MDDSRYFELSSRVMVLEAEVKAVRDSRPSPDVLLKEVSLKPNQDFGGARVKSKR